MKKTSLFSVQQMAALLNALPDPAFILTRSGRYAEIFGGSDARYYHDGSMLIGKFLHDVLAEEKAAWFAREIETALSERTLHIVEYGLAGNDIKGLQESGPSQTIWFEGRVQALDFQVDGEDAVLWVASNITARNALETQLRLQSETDELTGLYNRRKLMAALTEHYQMFARYEIQTSLFIFDIDYFKNINDQYGHMRGDQAIAAIAHACRNELRSTDLPARLGGDEFVILMPNTTTDHAMPVLERLRACISTELVSQNIVEKAVTISGGLSQFSSKDTHCDEVLRRGDEALYQAKHEGRNRIISN